MKPGRVLLNVVILAFIIVGFVGVVRWLVALARVLFAGDALGNVWPDSAWPARDRGAPCERSAQHVAAVPLRSLPVVRRPFRISGRPSARRSAKHSGPHGVGTLVDCARIEATSLHDYIDMIYPRLAHVGSEPGGSALASAIRHDRKTRELYALTTTRSWNRRAYIFSNVT
jgi:hypothetical protein